MKILIYEPNSALCGYLKNYTISQGLVPKIVGNLPMVQPLLFSGSYEYYLTDYSADRELIDDIIFNIKLNKKRAHIRIFISTPQPDKNTLQRMIRLGINGFIKKPFSEELFEKTFFQWLEKNSFKNNKRVHPRVTPSPTDRATAILHGAVRNQNLRLPIADISAGGMALLLPPKIPNTAVALEIHKVVRNIEVRIRHFKVVVTTHIVALPPGRICMEFVDTSQDSLKYIYRYIAELLNS